MPQALEGIFDAANADDASRVASFFSDDVAIYFYGSLVTSEMHGRSAFVDRFKKTPFSDTKTAPTRIWMKGNVAVVELTWTGTMTGDAKDLKATNKPIGQKRAIVYAFNDDGLVKEEHIYSDSLGLRAQMRGDKKAPPVEPHPTGAAEVHIAKGTPDEDRLVDWAKKLDDAFNTDDVKQAAATLADDVVYDAWGLPLLKGKKENVKDLQGTFRAFPDQKWTPTNVWGIDGYVVIEHVFTGTQKVPYGRMTKVTGKPVTGQHFLEIWQPSADGKLAHGWGYTNPVEAMEQAGAMAP
jgi:limonene-1,2-epoxide hydrolase